MFERFTASARQVIVHAQEASRELKHDHIGEEHILLGLIRADEGVAARALTRLAATPERMRAEVVRLVGEGEGTRPGQIPFTRGAKRMLERSLNEAQTAGDDHIATKHLLLSLAHEDAGAASRVLQEMGISAEQIQDEVARVPPTAADLPERQLGRQVHLDVEGSIEVGLTPRARRILQSAAEQALGAGRTEISPGDLLEPLISEEAIASLLSDLGIDLDALRERLQYMAWSEPETPEDGCSRRDVS